MNTELTPEQIETARQLLLHHISEVTGRPPEQLRIEIYAMPAMPGKTALEVNAEPALTALESVKVNTWLMMMNASLGGSPVFGASK